LTLPFVGYGQALWLNGLLNQQFFVSTPFLSLNSTSFTIEAWIYSTTLVGDRGIFGQCQCSTCPNQCFFFICRNGRLFVGFTFNDLSGTINMAVNTWYHVAFVYNSQTQQQILYVNGVQDSINNNVSAYQGKNGSIQIGSTQVYSATNYFTGYIDNVMVTTQAKSASQILSDASVVVYYSFDLPFPNTDEGPNHLNGTSNNTVTTNGRVNQAMRFTGLWSMFQVYGVYQVPYGVVSNKPFSVSMWINPTAISSCTFVQTFAYPIGLWWCTNILGIYSPGGSMGQLFVMSSSNSPSLITGPYVTQNTWSHVSVTYGPIDGYTLYYNGNYFGTTGNISYTIQTPGFALLYIGFGIGCNSASVNSAYQGSIDELYVHSRELTQADVTALANP
jgi:hypothetical protein